jgi:hypothetical protein
VLVDARPAVDIESVAARSALPPAPADWWADHVARIVKGLLVALVLVLVLDRHPDPEITTLALVGALVAVWVGDVYTAVIEAEFVHRRRPSRADLQALASDAATATIGFLPALVPFALAWAGILGADLAGDLAVWIGIAALAAVGLVAARRAGRGLLACVLHAAVLTLAGVVVLVVKALD